MALRAIWQFMDWSVTHKILYGPKRSWGPYNILCMASRPINCHMALSAMNYLITNIHWRFGPYNILWVTDRSINCHLARSATNYLLFHTQCMQICQTTCFCYCISRQRTLKKEILLGSYPPCKNIFFFRKSIFIYIILYVFNFPICLC
jgi:hypothetical protein